MDAQFIQDLDQRSALRNDLLKTIKELRIHQKSFFILTGRAKANPQAYNLRKHELTICKELESKVDKLLGELYPEFKEYMAVLQQELKLS